MTKPLWHLTVKFAAVCIAIGLCGCAEVDKLKEAQSAFSDAATADNQMRLGAYTKTSGAVDNTSDAAARASTGYARTISVLKSLSSDETKKLQDDKLWGVALTIQALSYWRLKDYDNADTTAATAKGLTDQLYPRDQAIVAGMPGLIKISEANDKIFVPGKSPADPKSRAKAADDLLTDAILDLDAAIASSAPNDPVYVYLLQAELSAYRNKEDARYYLAQANKIDGKAHIVQLPGSEQHHAQCRLAQLKDATESNTSADNARLIITFWNRVLGMRPDDSQCS